MRWSLPLALLLAACSSEVPPEEPRISVNPQPITYQDIEENALQGASCAYASGKSVAPLVMAMTDRAVMKIDGRIVPFTLDPQCKELRQGTGSRYLADDRVLDLAVTPDSRDGDRFEGSIELTDGEGTTLYRTEGVVQCTG